MSRGSIPEFLPVWQKQLDSCRGRGYISRCRRRARLTDGGSRSEIKSRAGFVHLFGLDATEKELFKKNFQ